MRRCIICNTTKPINEFNIEHIFPDSIGGKETIDCVCIECNTKLGDKIDDPFVDQTRIKFIRNELQIKNRNGKIPSILTKDFDIRGENCEKIIVRNGEVIEKPKVDVRMKDRKLFIDVEGSDWESIDKAIDRKLKLMNIDRPEGITEDKLKRENEIYQLLTNRTILQKQVEY